MIKEKMKVAVIFDMDQGNQHEKTRRTLSTSLI